MVEGAAGNAPLLWLVNPSRANRSRRQGLINQPLKCRKNPKKTPPRKRGALMMKKLVERSGPNGLSHALGSFEIFDEAVENLLPAFRHLLDFFRVRLR